MQNEKRVTTGRSVSANKMEKRKDRDNRNPGSPASHSNRKCVGLSTQCVTPTGNLFSIVYGWFWIVVNRVILSLLLIGNSCCEYGEMADSWHYKLLGMEFGPVPYDGLVQLAQSSSIGPRDEVREGEGGEWMPASSIVGLFPTSQEHTGESSATVVEQPGAVPSIRPLAPISTPSANDGVLFFWQSFGQEFGPVSLDEFQEMILGEQLSTSDQRPDTHRSGRRLVAARNAERLVGGVSVGSCCVFGTVGR